jgi:HEPN domain-containing protein
VSEKPPLDEEEFDRWRAEADRAFRGAELQSDGGLYNWSCFLCEQAAQLALKGLLHGLGLAPWGHDLVTLARTAGDAQLQIGDAVSSALHRLGRHYIPARHPDAHPSGGAGEHYLASDAEDALVDARAVLDFVDRTWASLHA